MVASESGRSPEATALLRHLSRLSARHSGGDSDLRMLAPEHMQLQERLQRLDVHVPIDADLLGLAAIDAQQLSHAVEAELRSTALVARLVERYNQSVAALLVSLPADAPLEGSAGSHRGPRIAEAQAQLARVIAEYEQDARRERRAARIATIVTLVLVALCAGTAAWAVHLADTGEAPSVSWKSLLAPLCLGALLAILAVMQMLSAKDSLRTAREYVRLGRGLGGLEGYLAPLPAAAQHLIRATMTQSLFPRLLQDDDPLRQLQWPESALIAQSVYEFVDAPETERQSDEVDGATL